MKKEEKWKTKGIRYHVLRYATRDEGDNRCLKPLSLPPKRGTGFEGTHTLLCRV